MNGLHLQSCVFVSSKSGLAYTDSLVRLNPLKTYL
jgi:hypothetical protein